jgi:hypothetical protein
VRKEFVWTLNYLSATSAFLTYKISNERSTNEI